MKKQVFMVVWLMMAGASCQMVAQETEENVNLEALYQQIDDAIEQSPLYVAQRENQIKKARKLFMEEQKLEQRFLNAETLFALFKPYKNDSALHYAQVCVDIADSLHRPDLTGRYLSLMARQCSNASMYVESLNQLTKVDKTVLDTQGLTDYYDAWMHVCGEIGAYSLIPEVRDKYFAMQDYYRDSVLMVADKGSDEYLHLQMSALCAREEYQEALRVSDKWLNKVTEGTHEDAYAAYYRHIVYDKLGNNEMVRFWLAKSAIDDIKCAVMDQASLITLAELLNYDGDLERSNRYIRFTWFCNNSFNTRLRSSQISPVLNLIEKSYQDSTERANHILTVAAIVFTILTVLLLFLFYKVNRQRRRLAQAHKELTAANEKLEKSNKSLHRVNDAVMKNNKQLFEINEELRKKND